MNDLNEKHQADLAASGIPLDVARRLRLRSASDEEVRRLLARGGVGSGMVIPYYDPIKGCWLRVKVDDVDVEYVRVKLDVPISVIPAGGTDEDGGRLAKYLTRKGTGQFPYVPEAVAKRLLTSPSQARPDVVIVTEGEKKAIAGELAGLTVIGLAGNFGWKVKDQQQLHPWLEKLLHSGCLVVIVWDSDAVLNTGFLASTRMLHDVLRRHGCLVKVLVLPQDRPRPKVGLDDFLLPPDGLVRLKEMIASTKELPADRQVTFAELILAWLPSWENGLRNATEEDGGRWLAEAFGKGLIDNVDDNVREEVIKTLQDWVRWDVRAMFFGLARAYAVNNAPAAVQESMAQSPAAPVHIAVGTRVMVSDESEMHVVRAEQDLLWVAGERGDGRSYPVLVAAVTVSASGSNSSGQLSPATLADQFLAKRFTTPGRTRTLRCFQGAFYEWKRGSYRLVSDSDIKARIMGFVREVSPHQAITKTVDNVLANLKAENVCHIPSETPPPLWLDGRGSAGQLIALPNGIIDVQRWIAGDQATPVLEESSPLLFTLNDLPVRFDSAATCPRWRLFLDQVLPNPAARQLLQEWVGHLLLPDTSQQKFLVLIGIGSNGKSVFIAIVQTLLGQHNVCSVPLAKFGEKFSLPPLTRRLLNAVSELPTGESGSVSRLAEDKLKAIVAGDLIETERKNVDPTSAHATARLMFATNELPVFADRSNGMWRRALIVPFDVVIPDADQDPDLADGIIRDELSGVFNWALQGLVQLRRRGHFEEPECSKLLKVQHRGNCAHEEEFLKEFVSAEAAADFVPTVGLYGHYRSFCSQHGYKPVGCIKFSQAIGRMFPDASRSRQSFNSTIWPAINQTKPHGWLGIRFHPTGCDTPNSTSNTEQQP